MKSHDLYKVFETGQYASSWISDILITINKVGDDEDAKNYKGITLISITSKI